MAMSDSSNGKKFLAARRQALWAAWTVLICALLASFWFWFENLQEAQRQLQRTFDAEVQHLQREVVERLSSGKLPPPAAATTPEQAGATASEPANVGLTNLHLGSEAMMRHGIVVDVQAGADPTPLRTSIIHDLMGMMKGGPRFGHREVVTAGGKVWTLSFTSLPSFDARISETRATIWLVAGVLMSLILFACVRAIAEMRAQAVGFAEQAAAKLRTSEHHNVAMFEQLSVGVAELDPLSGHFLRANPRFCHLVGRTTAELQGCDLHSLIHDDERQSCLERLDRMRAGEFREFAAEARLIRPDGSFIWGSMMLSVLSLVEAGDMRHLLVLHDVSERIRTQEILRTSEEKYRLLTESMKDVVWVIDTDTMRYVYLSPSVSALTGYTVEEILALPSVTSLLPEKAAGFAAVVAQRRAEFLANPGRPPRFYTNETLHPCKDGSSVWTEVVTTYSLNEQTGHVELRGVTRDISERKRLLQNLEQSHELLVKISAQVPGILFQYRVAPDGRTSFPYISDAVRDLYGLEPAALREDARPMWHFLHPDDAADFRASVEASVRTLSPWHHEYRTNSLQQGLRWRSGDARPVRQEDGSILYYGYLSDITERKQMEDNLRASEERFRTFTRLGSDWFWELDENYHFTEVSGRQQEAPATCCVIDKMYWELETNAMDAEAWGRHRAQLERHEPFRDFVIQRRDTEDGVAYISLSGEPQFDKNGRFKGYRGIGADITARKCSEEELELAALVYQNSSEAMSVTAVDGRIVAINPAFTLMTGYSHDDVVGRNADLMCPSAQDPAIFVEIAQAISTIGHWQGEMLSQRKNGEVYPVAVAINTIFHADGRPHRFVSLFSDITHRKQSEEIIWRQANFDALTGLPNRSMLYDRVAQEIKRAVRSGLDFALLFIDLDRFKEVNDTLGHDFGDQLLIDAGQRIRSCVRDSDTVARLGGDEFTVLLAGLQHKDVQAVERIARTILKKLETPFLLKDEEAYVSASIGITMYPEDSTVIEDLFRNADQAMYVAKNKGRNRYSFFTPQLQQAAQTRLRLINDMRLALPEKQFMVYFQPVIDLLTGRIVKAEALIRWRHPQRGLVSPAEFIPLAEDSGQIHEIGEWVFREAARWAKRWRGLYSDAFQISVNKSPLQFYKDGVGHAAWIAHLHELELPGQTLVIEITEGLLLDADPVIVESLLGCRDAGVQVAIDDFGTGYSSLASLKKFDIDSLKIDQSFTRNIAPGSSDLALSEAIIVMAHKLGLKVIAEGVETAEQRDLLAAVGCDFVQGYLFSKPIPPEEFEILLHQHKEGFLL